MKVEFIRVWAVRAAAIMALTTAAWSGTFGKVVPIGGQASDIALDEARGVLYIANFTANTIDVMSLADNTISTSINVAPQPGSLALSPDGQFLVIAHYGNFVAPNSQSNALTVINLGSGNTRQVFTLGFPPLAVGFGIDGLAIVVTTTNVLSFDPVTGVAQPLESLEPGGEDAAPAGGHVSAEYSLGVHGGVAGRPSHVLPDRHHLLQPGYRDQAVFPVYLYLQPGHGAARGQHQR